VTARVQARHAHMLEEQAAWLESHTLAMQHFDERMDQIAAAHLELEQSLKDLTKRLGGGGNGHGQA